MTIKEQVIESRLSGASYSDIKREFGIPKSTAQGWVAKWANADDTQTVGYVNENLQRVKPTKTSKEDVLEFLEQMVPLKLEGKQHGQLTFHPKPPNALLL